MAIIGVSGKIGSGKDTVGKIIQYLTYPEWQEAINGDITNTRPVKGRAPYDIKDWLNEGMRISINNNSNWQIKKFAYKLKQIVSILTGIPVEDLEKQEVKDSYLGEEWNKLVSSSRGIHTTEVIIDGKTKKLVGATTVSNVYDKITYREFLQTVGTEAMRNVIHENVWVNALFADYKAKYFSNEKEVSKGNFDYYKSGVDNNAQFVVERFPNWIITDLRFPNELKAVEDRSGITIRINRTHKSMLYEVDQEKMTLKPFNEHPSETALDNANFKYTIDNNGTIEELIEKVKEILIKEKII